MKRLRNLLLTVGILAGLGVGLFVVAGGSFGKTDREKLPPEPKSAAEGGATLVTVAPVTVRTVQRAVDTVGTLHGFEEVTLSSKVEGRVAKILHDVSDRVKPGEALLEIDPVDSELAVRQAERGLQVELARLGLSEPPKDKFDEKNVPAVRQAGIRVDNSRQKLERVLKTGVAVAAEEANERRTELKLAEAEYENQVLLAKSSLETIQMKAEALSMARQVRKDAVIRVPQPTLSATGDSTCSYAVVMRAASEGSFVRVGTEVFKLVIDDTLKLRAPVPEKYAGQVAVGQKVNVLNSAYPEIFVAEVKRVNPSIDPLTRTFEVEILVPNGDRKLKAGGFAKGAILTKVDPKAVTVPLEAVVTFAGVTKIFVLDGDKAKEIQVTLGLQTTEWAEILSPALSPDMKVITSGQSALASDSVVKVRSGESEKGRKEAVK